MGLKLLHHKSWHVYNAVNIERVRKDEEEAAKQNEAEERRTMVADSEARMSNLRKQAKKRLKDQQDVAEAALDRQLKGKGKEEEEEPESRAVIIRAPAAPPLESSIELDGHINFWADLERGSQTGRTATAATTSTNADHEAEARREKQKFEEQITMYIREPPRPWYSDPELASAADRKRTAEERLEATYKDGEFKKLNDPLALMNGYLDRRDRVIDAQERARKNPWLNTPQTLREHGPIEPKLLRPKKRPRSPSPDADSFAPMPPPAVAKPERLDARKEASARESSERARAAMLIAKAKQAGRSTAASTPQSDAGYQDRYNPDAMRFLKHHRWDDDRHVDSWRSRDRDYDSRREVDRPRERGERYERERRR